MRTLKAGLIVATMVFAVAACGSDGGGGFPGLGGKTNQADGPTGSSTPKNTTQSPTSRSTDDVSSPPATTRRPPTTSAPRPTTPRPTTASPTRGGSGGNDWSPLYSANFTSGCLSTSNNNTKYCQCALTELQAKYSQADMNAFDQEYARTNKLPAELQSTVQTCANRG